MTTYLLDDMAGYLVAFNLGSLGLTLGTNLFKGIMKNKPDSSVAIYEYSGKPAEYVFGPNTLPVISQPNMQLVVRDPSYQTGRTQIEQVMRALEAITNTSINGTLYYRVARVQDPYLLHRDPIRRVFFACNFEVMVQPS